VGAGGGAAGVAKPCRIYDLRSTFASHAGIVGRLNAIETALEDAAKEASSDV
jgi:hypothetical protein